LKIEDRSDKRSRFTHHTVMWQKLSSTPSTVAQVRHSFMRSFSTR
jgi:hypothetical protein